jgi:hypothetical protein
MQTEFKFKVYLSAQTKNFNLLYMVYFILYIHYLLSQMRYSHIIPFLIYKFQIPIQDKV